MKKVLNIISTVFIWTLVAITVVIMIFTVFSVNSFDETERNFLGYKFFIVRTDSMKATDFAAGDIIIVKNVELDTLKAGDIISYVSQNKKSAGSVVTHKIKDVVTDKNGNPAFVTYGTTTGAVDEKIVNQQYVLGKYQGKISKLGYVFQFLKTPKGYALCIFVPFVLLIIYLLIKSFLLFKRYNKEQNDELEKAIGQAEELRKELNDLKEQIAETNVTQ